MATKVVIRNDDGTSEIVTKAEAERRERRAARLAASGEPVVHMVTKRKRVVKTDADYGDGFIWAEIAAGVMINLGADAMGGNAYYRDIHDGMDRIRDMSHGVRDGYGISTGVLSRYDATTPDRMIDGMGNDPDCFRKVPGKPGYWTLTPEGEDLGLAFLLKAGSTRS